LFIQDQIDMSFVWIKVRPGVYNYDIFVAT